METNYELVERLLSREYIKTDKVEEAFREVDREKFVPEQYSAQAYQDQPLPIGEDATISAPHMVALNTELLEPEEGKRVLEIGSGSGYQLAILAEVVEKVVGVEIQEDLVEKSRENLEGRDNVEVHQGNGFEPVEGEFDRIIYSCAIDSIEEAKEHLKEDGIIVAPVNKDGYQVLTKYKDGEETTHGRVRFVEFIN